jgi:hypothetical protein
VLQDLVTNGIEISQNKTKRCLNVISEIEIANKNKQKSKGDTGSTVTR